MPYERWKVENEDERGEDGKDYSLRDDVGFDNHVVLWCSHCLGPGGEDRRCGSFGEVDVGAVGRDLRETAENERDSLTSMKEHIGEQDIVVRRYLTVIDSVEAPSISPIGLNNLRLDEWA